MKSYFSNSFFCFFKLRISGKTELSSWMHVTIGPKASNWMLRKEFWKSKIAKHKNEGKEFLYEFLKTSFFFEYNKTYQSFETARK